MPGRVTPSLTTAFTEEVIVNGYFIVRAEQFGWSATKALWVSLALRTSYHAYYGLGMLSLLPFGWFLTRSFQKHRRLTRVVLAHAVYDLIVFAIMIFSA